MKRLLLFFFFSGIFGISLFSQYVSNESDLTLQIYDLKGKLVQQSKVEPSEGKISLNIEAQAKGMYTAILSNGKKSYSGKIVFE